MPAISKPNARWTDDGSVVSIAVYGRSAYDLWLSENLASAEIVRCDSVDASHEMFRQGKTDVLASLKPKLREEISRTSGMQIMVPALTSLAAKSLDNNNNKINEINNDT